MCVCRRRASAWEEGGFLVLKCSESYPETRHRKSSPYQLLGACSSSCIPNPVIAFCRNCPPGTRKTSSCSLIPRNCSFLLRVEFGIFGSEPKYMGCSLLSYLPMICLIFPFHFGLNYFCFLILIKVAQSLKQGWIESSFLNCGFPIYTYFHQYTAASCFGRLKCNKTIF